MDNIEFWVHYSRTVQDTVKGDSDLERDLKEARALKELFEQHGAGDAFCAIADYKVSETEQRLELRRQVNAAVEALIEIRRQVNAAVEALIGGRIDDAR